MPDGTELRLLVVPPDAAQLEGMLTAHCVRGGRGDATIDQDQLKPAGDALIGEVLQHQLGRPVLVGRGRHDERTDRQSGHVDRHDALGALRAAIGAARSWNVNPPLDAPRARWVSMTTPSKSPPIGSYLEVAEGPRWRTNPMMGSAALTAPTRKATVSEAPQKSANHPMRDAMAMMLDPQADLVVMRLVRG